MEQKSCQARNLTLNQSNWNKTRNKAIWLTATLFFILACNMGRSAPSSSPDLYATLQASTPDASGSPVAAATDQSGATPVFNAFTPIPTPTSNSNIGSKSPAIPSPSSGEVPAGHIVFTCQLFKVQSGNQICIMNADGTGFRRLTWQDNLQHFYPSLSPDGQNVLYAGFREENVYEIYNLNVTDGTEDRLTNRLGILTAPEFSPDRQKIVFTRNKPATNQFQLMVMDANGDNVENIPQIDGWDTTWSPDGKRILFASGRDGLTQLFTVNLTGRQLSRITNLPGIRGRSDWSPDGQFIVTYSGEPWQREVYIMNADGSNVRQLTPSGGNSQGPSFSPDGKWVTFTAYFDHPGDEHGCEIYIIRIDGTDLRRLTDNDYCDYQPRWGP
jgi:tol-pal system beta propeller repeat protein TolB